MPEINILQSYCRHYVAMICSKPAVNIMKHTCRSDHGSPILWTCVVKWKSMFFLLLKRSPSGLLQCETRSGVDEQAQTGDLVPLIQCTWGGSGHNNWSCTGAGSMLVDDTNGIVSNTNLKGSESRSIFFTNELICKWGIISITKWCELNVT